MGFEHVGWIQLAESSDLWRDLEQRREPSVSLGEDFPDLLTETVDFSNMLPHGVSKLVR
jgi:hypothetical protein